MDSVHDHEVWQPIPGFPGYEISNRGEIRSWLIAGDSTARANSPRILTQGAGRPHRAVGLRRGGRTYRRSVRCLVLEAFLGAPPDGAQPVTLDGNSANAQLKNLAWCKSPPKISRPRPRQIERPDECWAPGCSKPPERRCVHEGQIRWMCWGCLRRVQRRGTHQRKQANYIDENRVFELRDVGLSGLAIARALQISKSRVFRILR